MKTDEPINEESKRKPTAGKTVEDEGRVNLLASSIFQQTLLDELPDYIFALDRDGIIQDVNRVHPDHRKEDIIGQTAADYVAPAYVDRFKTAIGQAFSTRQTQALETAVELPDGRHYFLNRLIPVFKTEQAASILLVATDITQHKTAELALQESEAKYRLMMDAILDPLYICSQDFKVEYMNPAMAKRLGRNAIGDDCHHALHGLEHRCDWCIYDKVKAGETIEYTVVSPLDERTYRVKNTPIYHDDGTISKMTIFRDITDYTNAVAEKEKAKTQLLQAQKMESIGNLAGGIAHDFNNILSSIIGFTELALDDVHKGTILDENLQQLLIAGRRAKDLVKQILVFARQSNDERKPLRVDLIAKEVLKFLRASIPTTIAIRPNIISSSSIMGNPAHVDQIFMNLCTNAAHAMEQKGGILNISIKDVHLATENQASSLDLTPGKYLHIIISDTGTGIPPEDIDAIFEPYFTTKSAGKGTGMGLAVVHGIVESYGGKIIVDSRLGAGTAFSIYLPIVKEQTDFSAPKPESLPRGTERILMVDDEASITKAVAQILERLGYRVTTRTSSVEALSLFKSQPETFDLVISDMTMPSITGDELAAACMDIRPDIAFILCTGYSNKISEETAEEIGIQALVYKPIVKSDLAKIVRKTLDAVYTRTKL